MKTISIACKGRPSIPPILHGYEFTPQDGTFSGTWTATIKSDDAHLFGLDSPGSPFRIIGEENTPDAPAYSPSAPPPHEPTLEEQARAFARKDLLAKWAKEKLGLEIDSKTMDRDNVLKLVLEKIHSIGGA